MPLRTLQEDSRHERQCQLSHSWRQGKIRSGNQRNPTTLPNRRTQFKHLTGKDHTFTRTGDSGKNVTYHNCGKCGTIMWVEGEAFSGIRILKTGTIDDQEVLDKAVPVQEIYCSRRPASVKELEGIDHKEIS